jgi:hypothetical protein
MGNYNSWYSSKKSHKAIEELKLNKVGVLLQIIDELKEMNLPVRDIESVLGACGLSYRDAMQLGNEIRAAREGE